MDFRIADTFTGSLARLTAQEQRAAKAAAFEMQLDPSGAGFSFHKLDRCIDKNFWSARVSSDLRIIVHRRPSSLLLAYVGHHDNAYQWAERRKIEQHPSTGAMQLVELPEVPASPASTVAASPAESRPASKRPFDNLRKYEVMALGVPPEWVDLVREVTEDTLLDVLEHLPQEAQENLLRLAVGEQAPQPPVVASIPAPVPEGRGGSVYLNRYWGLAKWISALVMPLPGLASAH